MKNNYLDKPILIVDDNKTNLLTLQAMLEDKGYISVFSVLSAQEMYTFLEEENIELVLLDVMMPDIDGIEACETLRKNTEYKDLSIIMVTGDESDETLEKSFRAGADDFTTKPINFINLHSRIQSVLAIKEKDKLILNQTRYAAMNDMIESLSEQWREPLSVISELALNIDILYKTGKLTKAKMEKSLSDISTHAKDLSQTIDEFKNVSVLEKKTQATDMNKLLIYALKIVQNGYKKRNIHIQLQEQAKIKKIMIYPNELIRVLLNLFINSQEAFARQEESYKKIVQVVISQDDVNTSISIKDNAGGIGEENMLKIFNPYHSSKSESGKGLGLYSCKQVIEEHMNGRIDVLSNKKTTKFTIVLLSIEEEIGVLEEGLEEVDEGFTVEDTQEEVKSPENEEGDSEPIDEISKLDEVPVTEETESSDEVDEAEEAVETEDISEDEEAQEDSAAEQDLDTKDMEATSQEDDASLYDDTKKLEKEKKHEGIDPQNKEQEELGIEEINVEEENKE